MKLLLVLLLLAMLSPGQVPTFTDAGRKQKLLQALPKVDALFEQYFKERQTPGLVFGVVIDQELVHVKAFGVRNTVTKSPVTADTMFRIASMTKSFTALAILKLRDAGKLSLDDAASKWVPELAGLRYPTRDTAPLTVRQLLTHGGGFPEDNPWGDRQLAIPDAELSKWIDQGIPFSTTPDTSYEYSNYGFALLGRIVSKASGMPYDQYLQREILLPLGLKASSLEPSKAPSDKVASGYGRRDGNYFEIPSLAHGSFGAMGGLLTSARDLGRYVAFQLSAEPSRDDAEAGPVRRSSLREMQRQWRSSSFAATSLGNETDLKAAAGGYGYGLSVTRDCSFSRIVAHGGGLPGFGSYMMWLPEYGVGLFAMTNLTYSGPSAPMRAALDVFAQTGGLKARELAPSPVLKSTQTALTQLWNRWDDAGMDALAADNLYLDQPRELIQRSVSDLNSKFTNCKPTGTLRPENWLRGAFSLACKEGTVTASFTLAPTNPPKVQFLRFSGLAEPSVELRRTAQSQAGLTPYGACTLGELLSSDGRDSASFRIACNHGDAVLNLQGGKATFGRAPGEACTP
jgi:CubicO group peptidase (beta-lactamase class C family)